MKLKVAIAALGAAFLQAGCFTLYKSEYPVVQMTRAAKADAGVLLSGFEASITSYVPIYGYQTAWDVDRVYYRRGRYHYVSGGPTTVSTTTYVPQTDQTTVFIERAQETFESLGYIVNGNNAKYRVEVKFSGPVVTDEDNLVEILWLVLSAFSADYSAQTWSAKLKIYETESNRMVFTCDYTEKCAAAVWGPLPILSPAGANANSPTVLQSRALTILTDRALADASAFLAEKLK